MGQWFVDAWFEAGMLITFSLAFTLLTSHFPSLPPPSHVCIIRQYSFPDISALEKKWLLFEN